MARMNGIWDDLTGKAKSVYDDFTDTLASIWERLKASAGKLANARGQLELAKGSLEPAKYQALVAEYNKLSQNQMQYESEVRSKMLDAQTNAAEKSGMDGLGIAPLIPIAIIAGSVAVTAYAAAKYKEHSANVDLFEAKVKAATAGLQLPELSTQVALAEAGSGGPLGRIPFWIWLIAGAALILVAKKKEWI